MNGLRVDVRMRSRDIDLTLEVPDGHVLAVLGPNGAGKSTLLSIIAGLVHPDDGTVQLGNRTLTDTVARVAVPAYRRGVATLSQTPLLFPHMDVATNVAFAPRSAGASARKSKDIATTWLDAVDAREFADRRPSQLSGGQAQRVALARALAADPSLLLLDEPMAALDIGAAPAIRRLLRTILRDRARTAVLVTHDVLDALALADSIVVIDKGRIVERGDVAEVLSKPRSAFAARMAGLNVIAGSIGDAGSLTTADGLTVHGTGDGTSGSSAVALFSPASVAVYLEPPKGSPRNIFRVTITDVEVHGPSVRLDGLVAGHAAVLSATLTTGAVAELDLAPDMVVYFAVKAMEVTLAAT